MLLITPERIASEHLSVHPECRGGVYDLGCGSFTLFLLELNSLQSCTLSSAREGSRRKYSTQFLLYQFEILFVFIKFLLFPLHIECEGTSAAH